MLATEGATSLFKASQLLEFTFDAYQYARGAAAQSQFDLDRKAELHLTKFEEAFRNVRLRVCVRVCVNFSCLLMYYI